jgi:hypothetical protein
VASAQAPSAIRAADPATRRRAASTAGQAIIVQASATTGGTPRSAGPNASEYRYPPNGTPVCTPSTSTQKPSPAVASSIAAATRQPRLTPAWTTHPAHSVVTIATVRPSRTVPDASG